VATTKSWQQCRKSKDGPRATKEKFSVAEKSVQLENCRWEGKLNAVLATSSNALWQSICIDTFAFKGTPFLKASNESE